MMFTLTNQLKSTIIARFLGILILVAATFLPAVGMWSSAYASAPTDRHQTSSDDGSNDDGSNDDGSNDDGSNDDGSNDDGSNDDGSNDDGSNDDGSNDDGSNDDGSNDDGSNDDGDDGNRVGVIESMDSTSAASLGNAATGTWVISGVSYSVTGGTVLDDSNCTLTVGESVRVNGQYDASGQLFASHIAGLKLDNKIYLSFIQ